MAKANIFSKYDGLFLERAEMYRMAAKKRWVQLPWNTRTCLLSGEKVSPPRDESGSGDMKIAVVARVV